MPVTIAQIQKAVALTRPQQRRNLDDIIAVLSQAAKNWLAPNSPWRKRAVAEAPGPSGFSEAMLNEAIDLTFGVLTTEALTELVDRELKNRRAVGPPVITHFLAGNVPPPGIVSICCGLLLRSGNIVRVSSNDPVFPKLFIESLREVDADLADCVAVLDWPKEETALTQAAMAEANAIIAYGSDTTIAELRKLAPAAAQFLGYGHRVSFGVIAKEAMIDKELAEAAAFDASVYDQQGCLSPHVFYVEKGAREFAAALAEAMAAYQARVPRGKLTMEEAVAIAQLRQAYEFRSASDRRVAVWAGEGWTVILDDKPEFTPSCLNRTIFVKPIDDLERVLDNAQCLTGKISTVGLSPMDERTKAFASKLAQMGVRRVCPIGQMQRPPLSWHHDGRPNLADLVCSTDAG
jgi:acyl-CoA reductase-like NAD-dependent aldehyde dehydrogenase